MKILFSFFGFLISFQAFAFNHDLIVKTESKPCLDNDKVMHGSGFLFSSGAGNYVLTSEHVVYQEKVGFCHKASNASVGSLKLSLLSADWMSGLALLKVESDLPYVPPSLNELFEKNQQIQDGDRIVTAGYPADSNQLLLDASGKILKSESLRHIMALVPTTIETNGSHVEFGMSGGLLLNSRQEIIGLLSHQAIELSPGQASKIVELSRSSSFENHSLSIPKDYMVIWARRALSKSNVGTFYRDVRSQISPSGFNSEVIRGAGLKFLLQKKELPQVRSQSGGDGVGIGGQSSTESSEITVVAEDLNANSISLSPNLDLIKSALKKSRSVRIPYFVRISSDLSSIEKVNFSSQAEFFKNLTKSNLQPVIVLAADSETDSVISESEKSDLKKLNQQLKNMSTHLDYSTLLFAQRVSFLVELVVTDQGPMIPNSFLAKILSQEEGWSGLYNMDFDFSVELNSKLRSAQEKLKRSRY